jgi:Cys-tRNA(Pro) deacylase
LEGTPALSDPRLNGVEHRVVRHRPARSLEEAAKLRGVPPSAVIKTMVVRRGDDDFLFVLVPGDRVISWPKLRRLLGVSRLSMPDAELAQGVTGYARGTITPLGSSRPWPVIADTLAATGTVSIGGGDHGVSITLNGDDLARILETQVADVTDPAD